MLRERRIVVSLFLLRVQEVPGSNPGVPHFALFIRLPLTVVLLVELLLSWTGNLLLPSAFEGVCRSFDPGEGHLFPKVSKKTKTFSFWRLTLFGLDVFLTLKRAHTGNELKSARVENLWHSSHVLFHWTSQLIIAGMKTGNSAYVSGVLGWFTRRMVGSGSSLPRAEGTRGDFGRIPIKRSLIPKKRCAFSAVPSRGHC